MKHAIILAAALGALARPSWADDNFSISAAPNGGVFRVDKTTGKIQFCRVVQIPAPTSEAERLLDSIDPRVAGWDGKPSGLLSPPRMHPSRQSMTPVLIVAVALLALAGPAMADSSNCPADLVRCVLGYPKTPWTIGYVGGVVDELVKNATRETADGVDWIVVSFSAERMKACFSPSMSNAVDNFIVPVREYVARNRGVDGQVASRFVDLLPAALSQAYPCPASLR